LTAKDDCGFSSPKADGQTRKKDQILPALKDFGGSENEKQTERLIV
jgi:hypothetical protein